MYVSCMTMDEKNHKIGKQGIQVSPVICMHVGLRQELSTSLSAV
jgi:hypothetical protein